MAAATPEVGGTPVAAGGTAGRAAGPEPARAGARARPARPAAARQRQAGGEAGRMPAWCGGLVLLGLGFTQLASGDRQAVFKIFGASAAAQSPAAPAGQGSAGSLPGITQGIPAGVAGPQDAAGAFPVIEPGGTIVPAQASITPNVITVPSGQAGVITSGPRPRRNLA